MSRAYEQVRQPHGPPWGCVLCGSATGPLADTYAENPLGRMYVCRSCARRLNRVFGFTPGKQLDELTAAVETCDTLQAELGRAEDENLILAAALRNAEMECELLQGEVKALREREQTRKQIDSQLEALVENRQEVR